MKGLGALEFGGGGGPPAGADDVEAEYSPMSVVEAQPALLPAELQTWLGQRSPHLVFISSQRSFS